MKKVRDASISINNTTNSSRKSFYELSFSLIFSFWCLLFLFYSRLGHSHRNGDSNFSIRETKSLEEVVWNILGYRSLAGREQQQQQERSTNKQEQEKNDKASRPTYVDLDDFRNKTMQGKERDAHIHLRNITHRLETDGTEYNYASASKGAKVLAHNKEAKGASNILGGDKDKYLRNPCTVGKKFVVIELAEETLVDAVKIANFEHHSSNFKDFVLSGSLSYPTETWTPLGNFVAANVKHAQRFMLPEPKWVRYLKLKLLSHYGSEFYCTLSILEVYGVDAIERMLEDLIEVSEEPGSDQSSSPNMIGTLSPRLEPGPIDKDETIQVHNGVDSASKGIDNSDNGQRPNTDAIKNAVSKSNIPDPVKEVRQQPNGRIPGDTVLKILMQKLRSLELNLSVLEEYIKELNRRQGDVLPELDKEMSRNALLLSEMKSEIKDLMAWKDIMEKTICDLDSWKLVVSSRIDTLVRDNSILRLDVEKVLRDQANMENKELAVLAVSLFFACVAVLRLALEKAFVLFGASQSHNAYSTSRGWILILVSSSMATIITLLYN
ncbi:PREDICTED: SUN domain-containing protein 2 isoform X2 [Nelumbo nucifera]|uniref:SUN domain-containing protein 2 isoform X2 n=1 Tax=Nelumbo nucifera TaxID=4432 RepID=A0A1U8AK00_NELNU|nr:PREDICTED: SUN domain-containing protein 2 isoform X2 [Nelumbo nucifera]